MFRPALGAVRRILLRSQAGAAGSLSRPAGASRLRHLHSRQSNVGDAAAHRFGFRRSYLRPRYMALAAWYGSIGYVVWPCIKEICRIEPGSVSPVVPSEIDRVEVVSPVVPPEIVCVEAVSPVLVPSEIDWVEAGVVSPIVRKQTNCGCCWAMAVASSVEAVHYMNTLQSISLSVQELIDCDTESDGCEGGHEENAFRYIEQNGLSSESDYPYIDERSNSGCKRYKTEEAAARILGFRFVDSTEDALEKAVAKQPVVVSLQGSDELENYNGGIMDCKAAEGGTDETHVVLIVGYGTDSNGIKYWRFKNSWGSDWGEKGFGRIRRHIDDERGVLGIFMQHGVYPVLED